MNEKIISCFLVFLIFINCIGCSSYYPLVKEDIEELSDGDKIAVTKNDSSIHYFTFRKIVGSKIHGILYRDWKEYQVVIPIENVTNVEVKKIDYAKTTILGMVGILWIYKVGLFYE